MSSTLAHSDILIIGGGEAGRCAAEAARVANPEMTITLVGEEPWLPYNRPPLSKSALADPALLPKCQKRDHAFYDSHRIAVLCGRRAERIEPHERVAQLADGKLLPWHRLILATGSRPRHLPLPPATAKRVHYLRTRDDAARLGSALEAGGSVGVIGAGFIGLEVAATARRLGCAVTVFERAPAVLARVLPANLASDIETAHAEQGVTIHKGVDVSVEETTAPSFALSATELASGRQWTERFDTLLIAIGVVPNVELAAEAGIATQDGIVVDASGRTSAADVFAAGEVTNHPVAGSDRRARYESWQVAQSQAAAVGSTAAGVVREYAELPWFWSDQYDLNIQMLGHATGEATWVFRGDRSGRAFTAFAVASSGMIEAAVSINAGRDIAGARRLMSRRLSVDLAKLVDPRCSWNTVLASKGTG
ncbi:MAG: FAD-dependent oxidoreductase [Alphaproteobacteria bacterium]|nr:FAD-dependent oxidoreductase [Alphaproteobacteria bacterium]